MIPRNSRAMTRTNCTEAVENAAKFGGDADRIFTIGASAGGALALQIANAIISNPALGKSIKGVAAMVSCTVHPDFVPEEYSRTSI